jgi:predicted aldo/keto reductase-like oxidoreductase
VNAPSREAGIGLMLLAPLLWSSAGVGTRHIGLTALGETQEVIRAIDSGRFDSAQVYYNLLNPSAARPMPGKWAGQDLDGVIEACKRHDMAVMGIRIFASGAPRGSTIAA